MGVGGLSERVSLLVQPSAVRLCSWGGFWRGKWGWMILWRSCVAAAVTRRRPCSLSLRRLSCPRVRSRACVPVFQVALPLASLKVRVAVTADARRTCSRWRTCSCGPCCPCHRQCGLNTVPMRRSSTRARCRPQVWPIARRSTNKRVERSLSARCDRCRCHTLPLPQLPLNSVNRFTRDCGPSWHKLPFAVASRSTKPSFTDLPIFA